MLRRDRSRIEVSLITRLHPNFGEVSEGMSQSCGAWQKVRTKRFESLCKAAMARFVGEGSELIG
jgi:hypothetical protein